MILFLRAAFWTILFPGVMAGFIPLRVFGIGRASLSSVADVAGLVVIAIGLLILLSSIVEFARRGRGTLSPVDPPTRLVVAGPYRWVRNPMYSGVLFILAGESLIAWSAGLVVYAAVFFLITNVFIAVFEEPYLLREFGESYEEYRRNVGRWVPRLTPWTASE